MAKFWDKEVVIGEVVGTDGKSMTRVALVEKDGNVMVDVRKFVKARGAEEGTYTQHTSSGLALPVDKLNDVAGAILGASELVGKGGFEYIEKKQEKRARKPRHKKGA